MSITTTTNLTLKVPYPMRHLLGEIKARGGRFDSDAKTWELADNAENRELAKQLTLPAPKPLAPAEERVRTIANVAVELLNGLRLGRFNLIEASEARVLIEKVPAG